MEIKKLFNYYMSKDLFPAYRNKTFFHQTEQIKNRGITLVELLIVVAVIGAIFTIGSQMLIQVNNFIMLSRVKIDLQRDARGILTLITKNLRQASQSTIRVDSLSNQPPYSRITFTTIDGQTFTFYQDGRKLRMISSGGNKILCESLSYLAFIPPSSENLGIISISLTVEKAIHAGGTKALHMASEKVQIMN